MMRTLLIAALLAGAIPAQAADMPYLSDLVGSYQLADGRTLVIVSAGRRLYAQLDGYHSRQVVYAGGASFVSRQGDLRLDFVQQANGSVSGLTLRIAAAPAGR